MFEAGSIVWRIQTVGKQVLKQDLAESEAAAEKAGRALGGAAGKAEDLGRKAEGARPRLRGVAVEIGGMSEKARAAAGDVGRSLAVIGAAMVATSALTVKAARDWETAWTGVTKTVDASPEKLAEIQAGLRDLAKELPASHQEIAAVAEAAGQLGVHADDIVRFTRTMIDLGETTNLTADEAATSLAQLMNIMQTAPEDVGRLGAAVVALGNDGASTERDIVQMAQRIAGAANIIGLTEGETLGLANALASVGIEAEAGGSSVSNIMIDISNAVSQRGSKLIEWAKLAGLSADEFAAKWRSSPAEALALVIEGMGRLNATGGDVFATLAKLGQTDVRVLRSLLNLAGAGNLLRDSLELGNRSWAEQLALTAEADKRYATAAAQLDMARNSVVDMAIELGERLLPVVVAGADGVANLANMVGSLPDGAQTAIAVLTALAGVIILFGGAAILAVPKVVAFRESVRTLAVEMPKTVAAGRAAAAFFSGPWGIALGVAVLGLISFNEYLKTTRASSDEMTAALKAARSAADLLGTASKGLDTGTAKEQLRDLDNVLEHFAEFQNSTDRYARSGNQQAFGGAFEALRALGEQLGTLARSDAPEAQEAFRVLAAETDGSETQLWRLVNAMPAYKQALIEVGTEQGVYAETMSETEKKQVLLALAQGDGVGVTQSAAAAYSDAASEVQGLQRDLDQLLDLLNDANEKNQDAISANIDYRNSLAEVDERIKKAREGQEGYALTLNLATQAGRDNMDALLQLAQDAWAAAEAQIAAGESTEKVRAGLEEARQELIDAARDYGATAEKAEELADKILAIPSETEWEMVVNTAVAEKKLADFKRRWETNQISIPVRAALSYAMNSGSVGGIPRQTWQADGGHVKFFAGGGENHVAQFARAGDYRVWAEPETKGEWYFPEAPEKRARSLSLARQMVDGWGYELVPKGQRQASAAGASEREGRRRVVGTVRIIDDRNGELDLIEEALR